VRPVPRPGNRPLARAPAREKTVDNPAGYQQQRQPLLRHTRETEYPVSASTNRAPVDVDGQTAVADAESSRGLGVILARTSLAVWTLTATAALITTALPAAGQLARDDLRLALMPASAPPATRILDVALTNAVAAGWPLLLALLDGPHRAIRAVHRALIVAWLAVNVIPVGAAIGAYGTRILPYLPHLPLEWTAIALALAGYLHARGRQAPGRVLLAPALGLAVVLIAAAAVETYATPHA
jgi:hypothetical protein